MKLDNEFVVAAPVERTWSTLLDLERVATCLPGATLAPSAGDGAYRGGMKVKLGPMVVAYDGVARLLDVDEDARTTTLEVQGREARGQGTAAATIRNRVEGAGDGRTRVVVETDLQVTGRQAQFGRGIMEDVAGRMLGEFAKRLEGLILEGDGAATGNEAAATGDEAANRDQAAHAPAGDRAAAAGDPAGRRPASEDGDALDLGSVLTGSLARSAPLGAGVLVAAVALLYALAGRRRRTIRIRLDLRA